MTLLLTYAFITLYCFGTQVENLQLGTSRITNITILIQAFILALGWPTVMLSWVVSHIPTYVGVYNYVIKRDITSAEIKADAANLLSDLYLDSPDGDEEYN